MSRTKELQRLAEVAQVMLDHRLGQLRAAAAELERSRMQLAAINAAAGPSEELGPVISERVAIAYARWADTRRSELNLVTARQTASWIDSRSEAQTAFGRVQALQGLAARLRERK